MYKIRWSDDNMSQSLKGLKCKKIPTSSDSDGAQRVGHWWSGGAVLETLPTRPTRDHLPMACRCLFHRIYDSESSDDHESYNDHQCTHWKMTYPKFWNLFAWWRCDNMRRGLITRAREGWEIRGVFCRPRASASRKGWDFCCSDGQKSELPPSCQELSRKPGVCEMLWKMWSPALLLWWWQLEFWCCLKWPSLIPLVPWQEKPQPRARGFHLTPSARL